MRNVLHDCMHRPREIDLVLVIHGNADEQLSLSRCAADILAQFVTF